MRFLDQLSLYLVGKDNIILSSIGAWVVPTHGSDPAAKESISGDLGKHPNGGEREEYNFRCLKYMGVGGSNAYKDNGVGWLLVSCIDTQEE